MKKLLISILSLALFLCLLSSASALSNAEKEDLYNAAIGQLEAVLESSGELDDTLDGIFDTLDTLQNYDQSKMLKYYTGVLIKLRDGEYDAQLDFYLKGMKSNERFVAYLENREESQIYTLPELEAYVDGRKAQHDGDNKTAIACYNRCNNFYDSFDRLEDLTGEMYVNNYADAEVLLMSGNLVDAYRLFVEMPGYRDSDDYVSYIYGELGYDPLHEHEWRDATCETPKICTLCGATEEEALGHMWDNGKVTAQATCISEGVITYKCMVCGITKTENIAIEFGNHSWLDATYDTPKACAWCGTTEGEPLLFITGNPHSVGSYVTFGHYPQTAEGNDNTPIEWLVLDVQGNKALLISKYGLDCKPYNIEYADVTWETCTLRTWLNDTFLDKAFTKEEQRMILFTNVDNSKEQCYSEWSTIGGNNTQDSIFIVSYAEANRYFNVEYWRVSGADENEKSRMVSTDYVIAQTANKQDDGSEFDSWWLRSPGYTQLRAAYVIIDGSMGNTSVHSDTLSVRPAFWLDLSGI